MANCHLGFLNIDLKALLNLVQTRFLTNLGSYAPPQKKIVLFLGYFFVIIWLLLCQPFWQHC